MTNKQLCRLQRLMLIEEIRPLTTEEAIEFNSLWALVYAEEGGVTDDESKTISNPCLYCNA